MLADRWRQAQRDELITAEYLVGVTHERREQSDLRLAQRHGFAIDRHAPRGLVQGDVVAREDLLHSALDATKHGVRARNDLLRIEGLDDVVVGSAIQPDDSLGVAISGRQHDDWNVRLAAQDPAQLYAVETRKHEIEDYQVGSEVAGQGQTGPAVTGNLGGESGALEIQLHPVRDPRIIFDYQYCAAQSESSREPSRARCLTGRPRILAGYAYGRMILREVSMSPLGGFRSSLVATRALAATTVFAA